MHESTLFRVYLPQHVCPDILTFRELVPEVQTSPSPGSRVFSWSLDLMCWEGQGLLCAENLPASLISPALSSHTREPAQAGDAGCQHPDPAWSESPGHRTFFIY